MTEVELDTPPPEMPRPRMRKLSFKERVCNRMDEFEVFADSYGVPILLIAWALIAYFHLGYRIHDQQWDWP